MKIFEPSGYIIITMPLPINYPNTEIGTSSEIKKEGLFYAHINLLSQGDSYAIMTQDVLGVNAGMVISLNSFYVLPKTKNIRMTYEESIIFNGIGKKSLCSCFPYVLRYFNINIDNTLIFLEASGGSVKTTVDEDRVNRYSELNRNKILDIYKAKYPESFAYDYDILIKKSNRDLIKTLVSLENNEKLIKYYENNFGFQRLEHISLFTPMATSLSMFLDGCNV
jgi:hypothetical protein